MVSCRGISTLVSATVEGEGDRSERAEVSAEVATKHRAAAARVVFLAQDRLDLGVAAVELAKTMAVPREGDDERLKRVVRYPDYIMIPSLGRNETSSFDHGCRLGHVQRVTWIEFRRHFTVGRQSRCRMESGSTTHCTEFWRSRVVCLHARNFGNSGFVHIMREFKSNDWGRIVHRADASACLAIMLRRRCGGLKQITVKSLLVQEVVREYY